MLDFSFDDSDDDANEFKDLLNRVKALENLKMKTNSPVQDIFTNFSVQNSSTSDDFSFDISDDITKESSDLLNRVKLLEKLAFSRFDKFKPKNMILNDNSEITSKQNLTPEAELDVTKISDADIVCDDLAKKTNILMKRSLQLIDTLNKKKEKIIENKENLSRKKSSIKRHKMKEKFDKFILPKKKKKKKGRKQRNKSRKSIAEIQLDKEIKEYYTKEKRLKQKKPEWKTTNIVHEVYEPYQLSKREEKEVFLINQMLKQEKKELLLAEAKERIDKNKQNPKNKKYKSRHLADMYKKQYFINTSGRAIKNSFYRE